MLKLKREHWMLVGLILLGELVVGITVYMWIKPSDTVSGDVLKPKVPEVPEVPEIQAVYDKLEPIVVNPAGTDGKRFLVLELVLMLDSDLVLEEIEERRKQIFIHDALVGILTHKLIDQLDEEEEQIALQKQMTAAINQFLVKGQVVEVCIKRLIIQ